MTAEGGIQMQGGWRKLEMCARKHTEPERDKRHLSNRGGSSAKTYDKHSFLSSKDRGLGEKVSASLRKHHELGTFVLLRYGKL